jgi:DNA-directed RNA polymerase specialized sigma24 family protein
MDDEEFSDYVRERRAHLLATAYLLSAERDAAERLVRTALGKLYVAWARVHRSGSEDTFARQAMVTADLRPGSEDGDELVVALAKLPPGQRRVVVLRYWLGLDAEEAALDLDTSGAAVESRAVKALETLRLPERELSGRMAESTAWTERAPFDPAAELRHAREYQQRWRWRRWLTLGAAAVVALAVIIAGVAVLTDPGPLEPATEQPPIHTRPPPATEQLASWFSYRLDPQRRYIKATDSEAGNTESGLQATMIWRQGTGHGRVAVSVTPPGRYDVAGAPTTSKRCQVFDRKLADGPPYTCRWTVRNGHRVLTGSADVKGVRSYFASYVRLDRKLIMAAVEGDRREPGSPPVRGLDLKVDDLVAAVMDPAVPVG